MKGTLIAVGGFDGTGKTTLIRALLAHYTSAGHRVVVSKQPSPMLREWGAFRQFLNEPTASPIQSNAVTGLIAWDRLNSQWGDVVPALEAGAVVICERYILDLLAMGRHRGAPAEHVAAWIRPLLAPAYTLHTDAPAAVVCTRLVERGNSTKWDERDSDRIEQILQCYRWAARQCGALTVDTTRPATVTELIPQLA